jgi:DNA helicase-2/ATP-dependent DNA helicase PcrA
VVTHAPVVAHAAADEQAEAGWISAAIDGLLGGTSFHSLDSGRAGPEGQAGLSLAGIAVLYRTDAQAAALGQALTRSGLAFRKGSHDLLLRRPGVAEILAELRHPAAGAPGPEAGGSDKGAPEAGGPQAGDVAGAVAAATARLAAGLSRSRAVDILAAGDVLTPLARRCSGDHERFRAEVALGAEVDALDPRADAVTLLTIHAAKGLEWDVVFVAGCETGLLPLQRPWAPADLAEERRLLFVAMTRARTRLFLSYAMSRTRQGMTAGSGASPFLAALEGLLEREAAAVVPRPRRPPQRQLRLL